MATIRKLRGRWQAQVRRRGSKPRAKSFDTKSEAERWARDLEAQVDRFGAAPDTRILESTTLRDLLVGYQAEVTPRKRGHVQETQRISVLLRHDLAHRTLIGLSSPDIAAFRDERLAEVRSATALREIAILSHVLEVAIRDWSFPLAKNVVKSVRRPRVSNARERRLHADEEVRLHAACETGRTTCLKVLMVVACESGMRRGELPGLRWVISPTRRPASSSRPSAVHSPAGKSAHSCLPCRPPGSLRGSDPLVVRGQFAVSPDMAGVEEPEAISFARLIDMISRSSRRFASC